MSGYFFEFAKPRCWISPAEEQHIEETLHALDEWGFDGIQVEEMIGKMAVPIVFCRLTTLYDFLASLSVDPELLCNFTKKIQSGFSEFSQFHGSLAYPFRVQVRALARCV